MKKAYYELRQGLSGKFHVVLVAPNGEIIGTSPSTAFRQVAESVIVASQLCSQDLKNYERASSVKSEPYFNLWNDDRSTLLLKSEMYKGATSRENGISAVIEYGPTTEVK